MAGCLLPSAAGVNRPAIALGVGIEGRQETAGIYRGVQAWSAIGYATAPVLFPALRPSAPPLIGDRDGIGAAGGVATARGRVAQQPAVRFSVTEVMTSISSLPYARPNSPSPAGGKGFSAPTCGWRGDLQLKGIREMACKMISLFVTDHSFGEVDDAVRHIMEKMSADQRYGVMIQSDTEPTMQLAEIEQHYAKITGQ